MATRNRTAQFRRHRDAVKSVRAPLSSSAAGSSGPVIEMVSSSLLRSKRSSDYAPLSTEDPGPSRYRVFFFVLAFLPKFFCIFLLLNLV